MKKIYILILSFAVVMFTSCDDWLDVKGKTEVKEKDMFQTKQGFCDALTGCYMTMADIDAYGKRLTYDDIENLADLWSLAQKNDNPKQYYLAKHDYEQDEAKAAIKSIYSSLFNVVAQANAIINNIKETGNVIGNEKLKNIIEGEAYAIRAYCQFDILRLFGQIPNNPTISVMLPYSLKASINDMPSYYSYEEYVTLLKKDMDESLRLLKDNDPLFEYTYDELDNANTNINDDYLYFRRSRLNYWAVMALKARMSLYLGENDAAHDLSIEILNAKAKNGENVIKLRSAEDLNNGCLSLPHETLFCLSKYNILYYTSSLLAPTTARIDLAKNLVISSSMLNEMFNGEEITSHNRYQLLWNKAVTNIYGWKYASLKKYYYDEDKSDNLMTQHQIIPMLRASELYLIAIETTTDLTEANKMFSEYMEDHNVLLKTDKFESIDQIQDVIINEYRREFFGEGAMFYVYKRLNKDKMLWNYSTILESNYILPLPVTEFNPNEIKNNDHE